jgi:Yip1 domain
MPDALALDTAAASPSPGLLARSLGVIFAPKKTYAAIVQRPRVLGALAVTVAIIAGATALFVNSEIGRQAVIEMQVRQVESMGRQMTDVQYQNLERVAPYFAAFTAVSQVVFIPLFALVVAGIFYALLTAILGGDGTFKQTLAVVVHSNFILVAAQFFILPLDYVRESLTSPTSLAVFLPFLEENSFLARFLGSVDLLYLWLCVNLAIGLGVLYRRRTGAIASGIITVYVVIALLIAAVRSALSGA